MPCKWHQQLCQQRCTLWQGPKPQRRESVQGRASGATPQPTPCIQLQLTTSWASAGGAGSGWRQQGADSTAAVPLAACSNVGSRTARVGRRVATTCPLLDSRSELQLRRRASSPCKSQAVSSPPSTVRTRLRYPPAAAVPAAQRGSPLMNCSPVM